MNETPIAWRETVGRIAAWSPALVFLTGVCLSAKLSHTWRMPTATVHLHSRSPLVVDLLEAYARSLAIPPEGPMEREWPARVPGEEMEHVLWLSPLLTVLRKPDGVSAEQVLQTVREIRDMPTVNGQPSHGIIVSVGNAPILPRSVIGPDVGHGAACSALDVEVGDDDPIAQCAPLQLLKTTSILQAATPTSWRLVFEWFDLVDRGQSCLRPLSTPGGAPPEFLRRVCVMAFQAALSATDHGLTGWDKQQVQHMVTEFSTAISRRWALLSAGPAVGPSSSFTLH